MKKNVHFNVTIFHFSQTEGKAVFAISRLLDFTLIMLQSLENMDSPSDATRANILFKVHNKLQLKQLACYKMQSTLWKMRMHH